MLLVLSAAAWPAVTSAEQDSAPSFREGFVEVVNVRGNVVVQVAAIEEARARPELSSSNDPSPLIIFDQGSTGPRIRVAPEAPVGFNILVEIPYGYAVDARAPLGNVAVRGYVARARLFTQRGRVELTAPWAMTQLLIRSGARPAELVLPDRLRTAPKGRDRNSGGWRLRHIPIDKKTTYGVVEVQALATGEVVVRDMPMPAVSPVQMHWRAEESAAKLLARLQGDPDREAPERRKPKAAAAPEVDASGAAVFRTDVRMVQLHVSIFSSDGDPVPRLEPEDFEVYEEGLLQEVAVVSAEEAPFNLAVLLDCSGSTERDRDAMVAAGLGFIEVAREQDRVAVYALTDAQLRVLSPLTSDREKLRGAVESIRRLAGGTPLYDAMLLGYEQELAKLPSERNALIVVTDGLDNQLQGAIGAPSLVKFEQIEQAAGAMNALLYPIWNDPSAGREESRVYKRMRQLSQGARVRLYQIAAASGGRLFTAPSLEEMGSVYEDVARELRTVYTLGYYPKNQSFDGAWRAVEVKVDKRGAKARTRRGYYGL